MNLSRILVAVVVLAATVVATYETALFVGGDQDAFGSATVTIRGTTLCWSVLVSGLDTPTAAHIHQAPAGTSSDCVTGVNGAPMSDIRTSPSGFYSNVHSVAFPGGVMRGQLF